MNVTPGFKPFSYREHYYTKLFVFVHQRFVRNRTQTANVLCMRTVHDPLHLFYHLATKFSRSQIMHVKGDDTPVKQFHWFGSNSSEVKMLYEVRGKFLLQILCKYIEFYFYHLTSEDEKGLKLEKFGQVFQGGTWYIPKRPKILISITFSDEIQFDFSFLVSKESLFESSAGKFRFQLSMTEKQQNHRDGTRLNPIWGISLARSNFGKIRVRLDGPHRLLVWLSEKH